MKIFSAGGTANPPPPPPPVKGLFNIVFVEDLLLINLEAMRELLDCILPLFML